MLSKRRLDLPTRDTTSRPFEPEATTGFRSKIPVVVALGVIVVLLGIGVRIEGTVAGAWRWLKVPSLSPLFADTRTITHSIDCLQAGQNPYVVRSFDPWQRVYNYPPIWLDARYLGINSASSNFIGTMLALLLAAGCLRLFRTHTWVGGLIIFFAMTSRAVLFAVERGNTDQLIFALLVFGLFFIERQQDRFKTALVAFLIIVLTILKIYPIVAVILFLRSRNGIAKVVSIAAAALAALVLTSGRSLPVLLGNTPRDYTLSFGSFPFLFAITKHLSPPLQSLFVHHHFIAPCVAMLMSLVSCLLVFLFRKRAGKVFVYLDARSARGQLALCGLAIYWFTFVTGASYDYRLIFLLAPIAILVDDLDQKQPKISLAIATAFLLLMWGSLDLSVYREVIDGLVFVLVSGWLCWSLFQPLPQPQVEPAPQLTRLRESTSN
jgi:glycosyl transferase family 87